MVRHVIRQNEGLAQFPGHEASAARRIDEGHDELERFAEAEAELERKLADADGDPTGPDQPSDGSGRATG